MRIVFTEFVSGNIFESLGNLGFNFVYHIFPKLPKFPIRHMRIWGICNFFYKKIKKNVLIIWDIKNKDAFLRRQTMTNILGRFI